MKRRTVVVEIEMLDDNLLPYITKVTICKTCWKDSSLAARIDL